MTSPTQRIDRLRATGQFKEADAIRDELIADGFLVNTGKQGTTLVYPHEQRKLAARRWMESAIAKFTSDGAAQGRRNARSA